MTEAIKQWIADEAQKSFMNLIPPAFPTAFASGLTKGIEIAEGFQRWIRWRGIAPATIPDCYTYEGTTLTTSQLLELYLKTLEP